MLKSHYLKRKEKLNENLGDADTWWDAALIYLSFSRYHTQQYNQNGKSIYTSKLTVILSVFLMLTIPLLFRVYVNPLLSGQIVSSEFKREPLSNQIGLTSNFSVDPDSKFPVLSFVKRSLGKKNHGIEVAEFDYQELRK